MNRSTVSVYNLEGGVEGTVGIPDVFNAPVRKDIVNRVHTAMMKNTRQPHSVKIGAGMGHSAESWGTGRAVARIPRVSGSGTSRAGQGAFGNMCRKGRMFAPIRVWRKWGVKIPVALKRYSVVSSIAASACTALVAARGHRVDGIKELPLVVSNDLEGIQSSKDARKFVKAIGAEADRAASEVKRHRAGSGNSRNRPYARKKGPLVIYLNNNGICQSFRNVIGVETMWVKKMNVLGLAPGGHVGRFVIWTKGAFEYLNNFGSYDNKVGTSSFKRKSGVPYTLPRPTMKNNDVNRIIHSDSIQNALLPKKVTLLKPTKRRINSIALMNKLNPYHYYEKRNDILKEIYLKTYGISKPNKMRKKKLAK